MFESLIEGVDFTEQGLKKAYQILEKVEGKRYLYKE